MLKSNTECYKIIQIEEDFMKKDRVSMTIDKDLIEKVKLLAEQDQRSFSSMVSVILRQATSKKEKAV